MSKEGKSKLKKILLPHEKELLEKGKLKDVTHKGSSAIWLDGEPSVLEEDQIHIYRPMGDTELLYLVKNNQLPDTQPYQTVVESYDYAEKYLNGKKRTDTNPSTVVEFTTPKKLFEYFKTKQIKIEDGCLSVGLGFAAGKCLPMFNESLEKGETYWNIVKVKRKLNEKE